MGAASNVYTKTTFTATASQTTFTLNYNIGYVDVYLNGVKLTTSDYTASTGTTVVLSVAAALNDIVETIAWTTWSATNTAIGAGTGTSLVLSGAATALTFNGSTLAVSTQQVLTTGTAATYTTPANVRQLKIRMVGGGGGGSAGSGGGGVGGTGGTTTFNSINAAGGTGGQWPSTGPNTLSGTGTGTANFRSKGAAGIMTFADAGAPGTNGASSLLGPGGTGSYTTAGNAAPNNSGGGGGGGHSTGSYQGSGGGAGEYVELVINSPSATYTYTIGTSGAAAAAGAQFAGGAGGTGIIIVDEYY